MTMELEYQVQEPCSQNSSCVRKAAGARGLGAAFNGVTVPFYPVIMNFLILGLGQLSWSVLD